MASIICLDLQLAVHLNGLMQTDRDHFLHAVLDHLRGEEVSFALSIDRDLTVVLQQNRADRFGRLRHVDRSVVSDHLGHVGQSTAVIQMKVGDYDAIQVVGEWSIIGDVGEVGKPSLLERVLNAHFSDSRSTVCSTSGV